MDDEKQKGREVISKCCVMSSNHSVFLIQAHRAQSNEAIHSHLLHAAATPVSPIFRLQRACFISPGSLIQPPIMIELP